MKHLLVEERVLMEDRNHLKEFINTDAVTFGGETWMARYDPLNWFISQNVKHHSSKHRIVQVHHRVMLLLSRRFLATIHKRDPSNLTSVDLATFVAS